jgi:hypothetical protein
MVKQDGTIDRRTLLKVVGVAAAGETLIEREKIAIVTSPYR